MDGTTELLESDRRFLVHPLHHPEEHKAPLLVEEGRGAMLHLADGRQVIDGLAGLWNVNVGHGRGVLADAAAAQMRKIAYASAYVGMTNAPAVRLAEKIVGHAYPTSSAVYYTTAGAESNELAFKTARYYWKVQDKPNKVKIISRTHAYHGVTMAAMSATGMAIYHKMFGPLVPGFIQVAPPYAYRWQGNEEPGVGAADAVEKAILAEGPDTVAAVICEPVMGAGGVIVPPESYFPRLREICDRYEVLLIADEVITGFGRTGRWFALGHWGVEPDIVSFAKGVTSGYLPLGGIILSERVHDAILAAPMDQRYMHAATYSGHPVCCAVGPAQRPDHRGREPRRALGGDGQAPPGRARRTLQPAECRRGARARHDVRHRAGRRQEHQGAGIGARRQDLARGDGAGSPGAGAAGQRRPGRWVTRCACRRRCRPRRRSSTRSRRSCANRSSPRRYKIHHGDTEK